MLTVLATRERMVSSLLNVSAELAVTIASGLGVAVPRAMPKGLANPAAPEVTASVALSLTAVPGDGGIRSRSVAILVTDGADGQSFVALQAALLAAVAKVHLIAPRLGLVKPSEGEPFEAVGTLENSALVLLDGLVLPDGAGGAKGLGTSIELLYFISSQHRHGKTILVLGTSKAPVEQACVATTLANCDADPGIVMGAVAKADHAVAHFITAFGRNRHREREAGALVRGAVHIQ